MKGGALATTVLSYAVIQSQKEHGVIAKNQKLLSFTDNRQDASLQAGHFNDFLVLARLRAGVYKALTEAPEKKLDIDHLPARVAHVLNLKEGEYAKDPSKDPDWPDDANEKALREYLALRILYDLKRGWRYNTPDLEQCGLLKIRYLGLAKLCANAENFAGIPVFGGLKPEEREQYLTEILNHFRTRYAFQYYKLEGTDLGDMEERMRAKLDPEKLWSLDRDEKIELPSVMVARSVGRIKGKVYTHSIGPNSSIAKYLRSLFKRHEGPTLTGKEYTQVIESLCDLLCNKPKILKEIPLRGDKGEAKGYRIMISHVEWHLGDGKNGSFDAVRNISFRMMEFRPNAYFQNLYKQDFSEFERPLIGREHTGQLNNEDRKNREQGFRAGEIATLYCSPTMELGIDIDELNVVHMRNVPPNAANYAQRSGRAGRSGQAALVYTYCSNGSPHDRHYFKDSREMVSGAIRAPRLDLTNEELIRTHFHAYMLMEMGLADLQKSAADVLDMTNLPALPIRNAIALHIQDHVNRFGKRWMHGFREIVESIQGIGDVQWLTDEWLERRVVEFPANFDRSFDRWRILYRNATALIEGARSVLDDPTITQDNPKRRAASRDEGIGYRQRFLLMNDEKQTAGGNSEFYVYRYLAAEGLLPGYGFTRLPVRAFLGDRQRDKGDFLSRPRFIALREFGPRNTVYHNGGKFEVHRMLLRSTDVLLHQLKASNQTGYAFLDEETVGVNNDPITQAELSGQDMVELENRLIEMQEVDARPRERISCEEEERNRKGFDVAQYFSFPKGIGYAKQQEVLEGGEPILNVIYYQAARLIQVNQGWARTSNRDGFPISLENGRWPLAKEIEGSSPEDRIERVKPYTTDTADVLYLQPMQELGLDLAGVTTMAYALKRAIERRYQCEEREIAVWIMGNSDAHRNILIYEAAEGSLGILAQIIQDGNEMRELFREAYRVIHFDPDTQEDTAPELPKATYEDLLSYFNQRDHELLDRYLIAPALVRLIACQVAPKHGDRSAAAQYAYLLEHYDKSSEMERKLLDFLYHGGYALPDRAQINLPECYVSADFVYKTVAGYTVVFCDGSVHDRPDVKADDQRKRTCAKEYYDVIEWHYTEPLPQLVERRKDIFRKVR